MDRASEVLRAVSGSTLAARLSVNIELAPNDASAHLWYGMYWALLQRREASLPELRFAQQLDPLSIQTSTYVGFALYLLRDYAQVIAQSQESLKIDPQNWGSHANLGEAYHQTGKYIEAITEFEKAKELSDSPALLAELRHADGAAGKNAEARRVLAELKELSKRQYVPAYAIAVAYLGLGIERKL
ncbi:MAG TPA: tetratricopeptide repeat protein [Candidatus Dormibacteraeota bacterium]|nr:tetratricopeptide repeat protein [Candidatus Dormibacteraeota bacterium]